MDVLSVARDRVTGGQSVVELRGEKRERKVEEKGEWKFLKRHQFYPSMECTMDAY